jgi:uncharacterized repeat protein (TIGR01451 family)
MQNLYKCFVATLSLFFIQSVTNITKAQNCGTIYGAGYSGTGSSAGVRSFDPVTKLWTTTSLIGTTSLSGQTINNGGPIAIDPLNQNINMVTDATNPFKVILFKFNSTPATVVSYPAVLNGITDPTFCSGYKPASHVCYYMTATLLKTNPTSATSGFYSMDFTNPAAPVAKKYAVSLAPGSPLIQTTVGTSTGCDLCFDANGVGYLVTVSKQLYRIVTDETAGTAVFSYLGTMSALTFSPGAVAFDPANNKLVLTGNTQTVAEYDLATNSIVPNPLTTTSGYIAPDLASCFYPNVAPALSITKKVYDSTQHTATPLAIGLTDQMEYIITVKNTGTVNAGGFTITDPIPAGVTYVAGSTRMNGAVVTDATGGVFPFASTKAANSGNQTTGSGIITTSATTVTTGVGTTGFDSCVITYLVTVSSASGTTVNNTATASISGLTPTTPITQTSTAAFKVGAGILPIILTDFTARYQNGGVQLNWSTAREINHRYFEIERSVDGIDFTGIGNVLSGGTNSTNTLLYNFTDIKLPITKVIYYRLKQVDVDGHSSYSNIVLVHAAGAVNSLSVFPSPAVTAINIDLGTHIKSDYTLLLIDAAGRVVNTTQYKNVQSGQVLIINRNGLSTGIYMINLVQQATGNTFVSKAIFK